MEFKNRLNEYIDLLGCQAKDLSEASGLSPTVISRYRSGERIPAVRSIQLSKLCHGIVLLAKRASITDLSEEEVSSSFLELIDKDKINPVVFGNNLSIIISLLEINKSDLSRYLNYDPSYLSRICSGQRFPSNPEKFIQEVCRYIIHKYSREPDKTAIASLLGCDPEELDNVDQYSKFLMTWFGSKNAVPEDKDYVLDFLRNLDSPWEETLSDQTDDFFVLSCNKKTGCSFYHGRQGIKQSQIDFFLLTAESDLKKQVFLFSDIAPSEFEKDSDFFTVWMKHISRLHMKGFEVNVIVNFEQSVHEMVHYIYKWLPLYSSSRVHLYYITESPKNLIGHFLCASSVAVINGQLFHGFSGTGDSVLFTTQEAIAHNLKKVQFLLEKAHPLIEIYKEETHTSFLKFMNRDKIPSGIHRTLTPSLPAFILSDEELRSILEQNHIDLQRQDMFLDEVNVQRKCFQEIMIHGHLHLEVPNYNERDFVNGVKELYIDGPALSFWFPYTYSQYQNHLVRIQEYKESHPNFSYQMSSLRILSNLHIFIKWGHWVKINKKNSPHIIFIVHHPKLRMAIENLVLTNFVYDEINRPNWSE